MEMSKRGIVYKVANGEPIPNKGGKALRGLTEQGMAFGFATQIVDVTKTLCELRLGTRWCLGTMQVIS